MTLLPSARPWLRTAAISIVVSALVAGTMAVAWQLALARVPSHRATLERLVQAHTGLDMRFNELGLRWGWYGPEAVFRDVELGEPGGTAPLLRAPELTVGFDAWRTLQTGQLRAGRVTLVAPEIDLARPSAAVRGRATRRDTFSRVLHRWQGGRVDVESGTLRMPLGDGSVVLRVTRGTLRHSNDTWSAVAQLLLPDRLGRHARLALSLQGDPARPETLSGRLQLEGQRLTFAGWRELLATYSTQARHLPAAGTGNLELRGVLRNGVLVSLHGEIAADDVRLVSVPAPTTVGYLSGSWSASNASEGWRIDVKGLRAGPEGRNALPAALTVRLDPTGRRGQAVADLIPLDLLATALQGALPNASLSALRFAGLAEQVEMEWNGKARPGARFVARAQASGATFAVPSRGWSIERVKARLAATDRELLVDLESPAARVSADGEPKRVWEEVELAARVIARPTRRGWEVSTERLIAAHDDGRVSVSGRMTGQGSAEPRLTLRATVSDASLEAFGDLMLVAPAGSPSAAPLPNITRGRIERGDLEYSGPLAASVSPAAAKRFEGSLEVRGVAVAGTDTSPAVDDVDAHVQWNGARFHARIARGQAAGVQITGGEAEWSADGGGPLRVSGRAYGRIEQGLEWLRAHETLHRAARNAHLMEARGDALLDFAVSVPADGTGGRKVRLALSLEGARVVPGRALPPVERLRGTLVVQDGRLRRTTLTGHWLGGPLSIRLDEGGGEGNARVTELQAQGVFDASLVARAAGFDGAERLAGESDWRGTLVLANTEVGTTLQGHAETRLEGIESALPAPLAKSPAQGVPLRLEIEMQNAQLPELRVLVENRLGGTFALEVANDGWRVERGSLRIGTGIATLPATPALVLAGSVGQLDLPAWLALTRTSARAGSRPPLWAELSAASLDVAGRSFPRVEIMAREDDGGLHVRATSRDLTGTLHVPPAPDPQRPIEVTLATLRVPSGEGDALDVLVNALAPAARVQVEEVTWQGRPLGRLQADVRSDPERVNLDALRFASATHELAGSAECGAALERCRLELQLASTDASRTLRDFGLADDVEAQRARLTADLEWQRAPDQGWLASLDGQLAFVIERGRVRAATQESDPSFALLVIPALLANADPANGTGPDAEAGLTFRRLTGEYTLRDGQATTANLHLDGEAEILARGRVGLVERDYEQVAWVLEGEERLPSAVRRFAASPRVAAAWLQLRDFFGGPEVEHSRAVLHLHGSWMRPIVSAPVQEEEPRG